MPDHLAGVKALTRNYHTWAKTNLAEKPDIAKRQAANAADLEALIAEVETARGRLRSVANTLGDLSDLPPEVLAELSVTKLDELEQQIRDIVASGDEVGLDAVIVELYRRHKIVQPRRFVMNKLYRMAQKGLIYAVEAKKGVYTVDKPKPVKPAFGARGAFDDLDDDVPF